MDIAFTDPDQNASLKARQILEAAKSMFLDQGYGAVSMDAIARTAGVSKATLYAHFSSKDKLFAACVQAHCRAAAQVLVDVDVAPDIRTVLTDVSKRFMALILDPVSLAIHRVVIAECVRFPELGRVFYESGPLIVRGSVAKYLASADRAGIVRVPDPNLAAMHLFGMLKGDLHLAGILNIGAPPTQAEIDAAVAVAVETFLRAYAA
jgi:AcrR family transcriptional regulator